MKGVTRTTLGEVTEILSGFAFKSELFSDDKGIPVMSIRDVERGFSKTYYSGPYSDDYIVNNRDLLVGMDGEFRAALWKGGRALLNQRVCRIEPLHSKLDKNYLLYFLPQQLKRIEDSTPFVTVKHLSKKTIQSIQLSLPPLPEQRRIAAILDKADSLREKRRQAIAKLDELLKSAFIEMFGDPMTNPKGWPVGSIEIVVRERSDVRCGPFGTQLKVDELVSSGVPLFGIENVHNDRFVSFTNKFLTQSKADELSAFSIQAGDVLVTRMGTIGRACVVPQGISDGRISYHLFRVRPDKEKYLPEFLAATICRSGTFQMQLRTLSHGAIMAGL